MGHLCLVIFDNIVKYLIWVRLSLKFGRAGLPLLQAYKGKFIKSFDSSQ